MAKHTTLETVNFNGFSGYYGSMSAGYGGLQWDDMDFLNATFWQKQETQWCDTGYQNVIKGAGEAFSFNNNGSTSYGLFETANLSETFSLKSMIAASAWETKQPFDLISFTYTAGQGLIQKASATIEFSQTARTIEFAKIGKPGDFNNIAALAISSGTGKYGNTCSYGPYGYTLGNELAFDNLKLQWNGAIPKGHGKLITPGLPVHEHGRAAHVAAAQLVSGDAHHDASSIINTGAVSQSVAQGGFHSELLSLGDAHGGNLTGQFQLPMIEHFGT